MPPVSRIDNVADSILRPQHLNKPAFSRYLYDPFNAPPIFADNLGNGAAVGTTGAINLMKTPYNTYEWHVLGAGQTIAVPVFDRATSRGIDFGQDQVATEGHQLRFGPNMPVGAQKPRGSYIIGTDKAFYGKVMVRAQDASGLNPFVFGLFKQQAYQTALASYTDFAVFNAVVNGTVADIQIKTSVASVVTTVDTTQDWVDAFAIIFELRVTQDGRVSFFIDGKVPLATRSGFQFAPATMVHFGTFFLHGTDLCDNLYYQLAETGDLTIRGS